MEQTFPRSGGSNNNLCWPGWYEIQCLMDFRTDPSAGRRGSTLQPLPSPYQLTFEKDIYLRCTSCIVIFSAPIFIGRRYIILLIVNRL